MALIKKQSMKILDEIDGSNHEHLRSKNVSKLKPRRLQSFQKNPFCFQ